MHAQFVKLFHWKTKNKDHLFCNFFACERSMLKNFGLETEHLFYVAFNIICRRPVYLGVMLKVMRQLNREVLYVTTCLWGWYHICRPRPLQCPTRPKAKRGKQGSRVTNVVICQIISVNFGELQFSFGHFAIDLPHYFWHDPYKCIAWTNQLFFINNFPGIS